MKKTSWIVATIVIIAIIGIYFQSNRSGVETKPTNIGLIVPLSGNVAFLGEGMRDAANLALSEIQNTKHQYKIIVEDDGFEPKKSVSAFNKLKSADNVSTVITIASAAGNVINPIAEQSKIIHFGIASDPNVAKGYYNFIHWTPPNEEVKVLVKELKNREYKRVAVFGAKIQGVTAVIDELKKQIVGTDITLVNESIFNFGTKDFRTEIAKAEKTKPDIYLLEAFTPELEILAKQIKEAGIKTPLTAIESFEQTEQFKEFEGDWYVNAADASNEFINKFKSVYGKNPSLGAANAYDIVKLIISASEQIAGPAPTTDKIAEKLMQTKISGALGELSLNPDGLVISKAVVRMIKNGQPVTIGE